MCGVLAVVHDDFSARLTPNATEDARQMLAEPRGARLCEAVRGRRALDRGAVENLLVALGHAMAVNPAWREVDLNPVIVSRTGALAVDALIVADPEDPDWDFEDPGGAAGASSRRA